MSHRSSSSNRARCFRPTLEFLEDRIVPDAGSDLSSLANLPIVKSFLNDAKTAITNAIAGPVIDAGTKTIANESAGEFWVLQVNYAVSAFNSAPNLNNLSQLEYDTVQLVNSAILSNIFDEELNAALANVPGDKLGFLAQIGLNLSQSGLQGEADRLLQAAHTALGDFFQAAATLFGGTQANLPTIPAVSSPTPGATTNGGYGVTYSDAPGSVSQNGADITESANVSASSQNDAPINVTIKCEFSDGTATQQTSKDLAPGQTATVSLTVMPCTAGSTGNWTVIIDGNVNHTATTVFTQ